MTDTRRTFLVVNLRTGKINVEVYASAKNVIRYALPKDKYDAGQYDIFDNVNRTGDPVRAYKRV